MLRHQRGLLGFLQITLRGIYLKERHGCFLFLIELSVIGGMEIAAGWLGDASVKHTGVEGRVEVSGGLREINNCESLSILHGVKRINPAKCVGIQAA